VKTIPIALQATYDSQTPTIAAALKITRRDGAVYAFTTLDESQTIDGTVYVAQGLADSSFEAAADLSVGNLTLTTLDDGTIFTLRDITGGLWQGARYEAFRYDWTDPGKGKEWLSAGELGQIRITDGSVEIELRDWRQYLQQPIGEVSSRTCRARLGDARCKVPLGPLTYTDEVTAVTSGSVFASSSLATAQPEEDFFGEGELTFTSGANVGIAQKVRTYSTAGEIALVLAMPAPVEVGDTFEIVAGCRKRLEDCRDKFDNVLNFRGEPHRPGVDALTAAPDDQ
jgi:uncharacterized phage protein (TIGR02218 family)